MTNLAQNESVIIITGMHRSGTSLTASLLQSAGVNIGDRLLGADKGNFKGHFEDLDFVEFHQNVLQSQGISIAGWTEKKSITVQSQYLTVAKDLISQRNNLGLWGWKDPRTVLFLDFWSELLPQAKYIFVYRSPWMVVDSLFRRGDIIFQNNPNFAVTQWCNYNQAILDFYQERSEKCLLLNLATLSSNPQELNLAVSQKWQLELQSSPSILESSLLKTEDSDNYRQALIAKFFPQAIELYQQLQQQSDRPSPEAESLAVDTTCQSWILQDWWNVSYVSNIQQQTANHAQNLEGIIQGVNAELAQAKEQLTSQAAELTQTQEQLTQTKSELSKTQEQLASQAVELTQTQQQLTKTQEQLTQTKSELSKTQEQLTSQAAELTQTQQQKQYNEHQLEEAEKQAYIAQMKADRYRLLIVAMETSKFWQLRKWWFNLKSKNGLSTSDLLYQNYLLSNNKQLDLANENPSPVATKANTIVADTPVYQQWLNKNYPTSNELKKIKAQSQALSYRPLISVIVPVYNPDENFLRQAIASVIDQVYDHWELCIADDCSSKSYVSEVLKEYAEQDDRIKVIFREENGHICRASNSALEIATGEYIALLDHDDLLAPHALAKVVELLNRHPEADFIYSDEDKVDEQNIHRDHFFKPDWCPDSFLARMYTCHLGVYRRSLVNEIGNFRVGFEGSQDYDLVLRLTEKTDRIFHIPDVLYHWRIHLKSTAAGSDAKPYAANAAQKAISEALLRREEPGKVTTNENFPGVYTVRYQISDPQLVSIIIPTKDLANVLNVCLKSIFTKTTYPNYEVIVIDNGSKEAKTQECFKYWQKQEPERFKCYLYDIPFNYSKINNYAASKAQGEYLLFLNNDTEVITSDWLEAMVEQAQRQSIGAVGSLLLYPDNTVQHGGVVLGIGGVAGHSHKYFPMGQSGYLSQLVSINNYSAVTGACLMCRKEVFTQVGGFEEKLAIAFNDVDLCLKIVEGGYRNIYLPHVVLYHYESKSRGYEDTPEKQARFAQEVNYMKEKWHEICDADPCYNPNLTKNHEDYSLNI